MSAADVHVVTGAFGYSGKYIARRLLAQGHRVVTLTNSPHRPHELGDRVSARPLQFHDVDALARDLEGARVLYNTYWVRFDHALFSHQAAVDNTLALFEAARRAKVGRVVHVSITNPSSSSPLPYFSGKAKLEEALRSSGLPYAIMRPAVLFGPEDILVNNIAWTLRTFPVFGVFGRGDYRVRPIHVDDLAALAVELAAQSNDVTVDAVGPESFSYRELVAMVAHAIGVSRPIVSIPPLVGLALARVIGAWKNDVFVTKEEIAGLMAGLLDSAGPPTGRTKLSAWCHENAGTLGISYASELRRRRDRHLAYVAPR